MARLKVKVNNQVMIRHIQRPMREWRPNQQGIPNANLLGRFINVGVVEACKLGFAIGAGLGLSTQFGIPGLTCMQ